MNNELLSVYQVADLLKISRKSAYKLLKNKKCPSLKINSQYKILENDLMDYLKDKD